MDQNISFWKTYINQLFAGSFCFIGLAANGFFYIDLDIQENSVAISLHTN